MYGCTRTELFYTLLNDFYIIMLGVLMGMGLILFFNINKYTRHWKSLSNIVSQYMFLITVVSLSWSLTFDDYNW